MRLPTVARGLLGAMLLAVLSGCAGTGDPRDPLEGFNRSVFAFNKTIDDAVLEPVARGYRALVPDPLDHAVTNFFGNLGDVVSASENVTRRGRAPGLHNVHPP